MDNLVEILTQPVEFVKAIPYHPFFSISSLVTSFIEPWINESGVNVLETRNCFGLEYADDIVCSLDSFEEAQATLNDLTVAAGRYGLSSAPSKCKVKLTDWTGSITPLTLSDEELDFVDSFTYLGSCINASENITDEITSRILRAQAVFGSLRHLWRQTDISLLTKCRVYNCTDCPTLIYGCEIWPIRSEDLHRLQVFDHRCLRTIGHIGWKPKISNKEVRQRIFRSTDIAKSLAGIIQQARLR